MPSTFRCPKCKTEIVVSMNQPGQIATCPSCKIKLAVGGNQSRPNPPERKPAQVPQPLSLDDDNPIPAKSKSQLLQKKPVQIPQPLPLDDDERTPLKPKPRPELPNLKKKAETLSFDDNDDEDDNDDRAPGKKKSSLPLVVGLVALVLVLGGGGVAAWLVLDKKKPSVADDTASTPSSPSTAEKPKENKPAEPPKPLSGEQVYKRLLSSTVLILTEKGLGSGVLVHTGKKLVVTNHHVIAGQPQVVVLFPAYDEKRQLVTSIDYYVKKAKELGTRGNVADKVQGKDLAIVEVERIPEDSRAVVFSAKPASTGANVFSIGASGIDRNLLWKLSTGTVTGRSERDVPTRTGAIHGMILETSAGTNPGDSGGPVVNDRAELVGVVSHGDTRSRDVSGNIDVLEIRLFLEAFAKKRDWVWESTPQSDPGLPPSDDQEDVNKLIAQLKDPDASKKLATVQRLAALGPAARPAIPELLPFLDDNDERIQRAAADALQKVGQFTNTDMVNIDSALGNGQPNARLFALSYYAAESARKVPEKLLPTVVKALSDPAAETR